MQQLIPLPNKKITFKKGPNGTKYVYYTLRAYRNDRGQPTSDEKSIGKLDPESGMLIPNKGYFDLFPSEESPKEVLSVGFLAAFMQISDDLDLTASLSKVFPPKKVNQLLSLAAYILAQGNVMAHFPSWAETHHHERLLPLSSQEISTLFTSITEEERIAFFSHWTKAQPCDGYIAYDVTSISTYSQGIDQAEWGYNRDGEKLAQINLGIFYSEESRLPLFYKIYPGSLVDKAYFETILLYSKHLEIERLRLVMDQELYSLENLHLIQEAGYASLSILPKNLNLYQSLLDETLQEPFSSREYLKDHKLYARAYGGTFEDIPVRVFMYYDLEKAALEESSLYDEIERREEALEDLAKQRKLRPRQTKYFIVEEEGAKSLRYGKDYETIDEQRKKLGYFALISTDENLDADDALRIYRAKDGVEKNFCQLKNGLDYRRMRTHYTETTEGKAFVAFLSLVVRSQMKKLLQAQVDTGQIGLNEAIDELERIQALRSDDKVSLLTQTKKQKIILQSLGLDSTDLIPVVFHKKKKH